MIAAKVDDKGMVRNAILSDDGVYRYRLDRRWASGPAVCWVMLNPSTADALKDDATVRKCLGFTRRWEEPALTIVNQYAYRTKEPAELKAAGYPRGGKRNSKTIIEVMKYSAYVILAWGAHGDAAYGRKIAMAAREAGKDVYCLGRTAGGQPCHPLMLGYDTFLEEF